MRRCQTFLAFGFLLAAATPALGGCAAPSRATVAAQVGVEPAPLAPPLSEPAMVEVATRALPAVVLLLNYKPDGTTTYGAGLIVGKDGRVLTNHHVIAGARSLGAMLYKAGRVSYTPMDGGLSRYLFENQHDVVATTLIEGDATSDLAIVKIDADTSNVPELVLSKAIVRPGERVFALGHPQETVWSFTAGAVSALHNGAIQHDAVLSNGSSGGPLLNARGEVIGVNTARVTSESRGLSFARPIEMASRFIARGSEKSGGNERNELDQTSPEKAVVSCWHAHELSSPSVTECVDWDAQWQIFRSAIDAVRSPRLSPKTAELVARYGGASDEKAEWIRRSKADFADRLRSATGGRSAQMVRAVAAARALTTPTTGSAEGGAVAELATIDADRQKKKREQNGIKVDLENPTSVHDVLRMGVRVEETRVVDPDRVWVLLAGRNPDGSPYRYSECWVKVGARWVQRTSPRTDDLATLPGGWAPPIDDFQYARQRLIATLVSGGVGG
ncbi:MAG: trypsin-like peptidase domain-containing protein [Byssovorax sp.]